MTTSKTKDQDPANTLFDPLDKLSTPKGAICPNQFETAPSRSPPGEQEFQPGLIGASRAMNAGSKQRPHRVNQDGPLPPFDPFTPIKAYLLSRSRYLYRLTIDDPRARLDIATGLALV